MSKHTAKNGNTQQVESSPEFLTTQNGGPVLTLDGEVLRVEVVLDDHHCTRCGTECEHCEALAWSVSLADLYKAQQAGARVLRVTCDSPDGPDYPFVDRYVSFRELAFEFNYSDHARCNGAVDLRRIVLCDDRIVETPGPGDTPGPGEESELPF